MRDDVGPDLRYAARRLRRSPGFATTAILTLALGIGANTAIFTVTRGILLDPLPYGEPDRLVAVWEDHRASGGPARELVTSETFEAWVAAPNEHVTLAAYVPRRAHIETGEETKPVLSLQVTGSFFKVLGLNPRPGRLLAPADAMPHAPRSLVMSHDYFNTVLGGDHSWIGRSVSFDGVPHTLIGVLPAHAHLVVPGAAAGDVDVVVPFTLPEGPCPTSCVELFVVGRLGGTSSPAATAQALVATLGRVADETAPGVQAIPLRQELTASLGPTLIMSLIAVGLVLLIACVNVANLLVARGPGREAEIAVRAALGARSGRILRQLLTENTLLTFLGGAAGLWVAAWAVDLVLASSPATARVPGAEAIGIDGEAMAFCAAVTILAGLFLSIVPVLQSARPRLATILNPIGVRGPARSRQSESGAVLIVIEVTAAGVLLLGAGMLIRGYLQLERASTGYDPDRVTTVDIDLGDAPGTGRFVSIAATAEREIAPLPGVSAVAVGVLPGALGGRRERVHFGPEGETGPWASAMAWVRPVTPSYFRFFGLDVVAGSRMPDRVGDVAVVSARFAATAWPDARAPGRVLRIGDRALEVVGVVQDADAWAPRGTDRPAVYIPIDLDPPRVATIMVATDGDPEEAVRALRSALAELGGPVPQAAFVSLEDLLQGALADRRLASLLLGVFAATAVALAAIGLLGVLHYGVARRRHEIGIRMALGATGGALRNRVIRQGVLLTAVGASVGIVVTLALRKILNTTLHGVAATDLVVFTTAPLLLCAVAVMASYVPARTAARIDPVIALRGE